VDFQLPRGCHLHEIGRHETVSYEAVGGAGRLGASSESHDRFGVVSNPGRILVIRGGAIGDFILTLPVLAALRQQLPRARLEVLGYPHIAQLALAGGLADAVHPIEAGPLAGFFARDGILDSRWKEFFAGFALILSFLFDPDEVFRANVQRCSKAQFLPGPHRPDEHEGVPAAQVFLKTLERLAIFDADDVPRLTLGGGEQHAPEAGQEQRRLLAVHPGSGSERKNWPEPRWAELLGELAATTAWEFLLVGGEVEGAKLQRLAAMLPASRTRLAQHLPLAELARRLSLCAGFLGHDSGISHLAAALGLRTLVLWGESVETVWRPPGPRVRTVRAGSALSQLPVATVLENLRELLET
jgi:heptosyltransferase III